MTIVSGFIDMVIPNSSLLTNTVSGIVWIYGGNNSGIDWDSDDDETTQADAREHAVAGTDISLSVMQYALSQIRG